MLKTFLPLIITFISYDLYAQIGIGTTSPNESSLVDLSSSEKGFLPPRLNVTQRNAISSPATGLLIYNTDYKCLSIYTGSAWDNLGNCDYTPAITFTGISRYNGISALDSIGIGYYGETLSNTATIEVLYDATDAIPYTFSASNTASGLTYTASGTTIIGTGNIVTLTPDTPLTLDTLGTINLQLTGASNTLSLSPRIDVKSLSGENTTVVDIGIDTDNADGDNDPTTGTFEQFWMDRNLGAHRKAESIDDVLSVGNLYQWGRGNDGHAITVFNGDDITQVAYENASTATLSPTDDPGHGNFITVSSFPYNWRTSFNSSLWQGEAGINNPCPSGYRLPTRAEMDTLLTSFTVPITNRTTAFDTPMKFMAGGFGANTTGDIVVSGNTGNYRTSTVTSTRSYGFTFNTSSSSSIEANHLLYPVNSTSIRCIKD